MTTEDVDPKKLTAKQALRSLQSCVCPACGGSKQSLKTMCGPCYHALPKPTAKALYIRIGHGYEAAVAAAFYSLGVSTFTLPAEKGAPAR